MRIGGSPCSFNFLGPLGREIKKAVEYSSNCDRMNNYDPGFSKAVKNGGNWWITRFVSLGLLQRKLVKLLELL